MINAEQVNDPALTGQEDRQPIREVGVATALKRIADGVEALTDEIRRLALDRVGNVVIDVNRSYSRAEVARLINVSTRTVDRRVRAGALQAIKNGNTVRIDGASLHRHRTGEQLVGARRVLKL